MRGVSFVALCAASVLAGCQTAPPRPPQPPLKPIVLSESQKVAVEEGVKSQLKDPESARFGTTIAGADAEGTITVCGWVNAKNSYGGYTGEQPFNGIMIGDGKTRPFGFVAAGLGGDDLSQRATLAVCAQRGLFL